MTRAPGLFVCLLAAAVVFGLCGETKPQPAPHRESLIEVDELPPVVDSVTCPPSRPVQPAFTWLFTIHAHDEAPLACLVTPENSLEYSYVFTPPPPLAPIHPVTEFSRFNRTFDAPVDPQSFPGEYTYSCRVRDRAGNISEEWVCRFVVGL